MFKCCYDILKASENGNGSAGATASIAGATDLARLETKVDALCETVEQLCDMVRTPAMANSKKK
jgi:hypothetical protein